MFSFKFWWGIIKKYPREAIILLLVVLLMGCWLVHKSPELAGDRENLPDTIEIKAESYTPSTIKTYFVDTIYDTIFREALKPSLVDTIWDTVSLIQAQPIDSLKVLVYYLASHIYLDTIDIPNWGLIIIRDSVSQNHIQKRWVEKKYFLRRVNTEMGKPYPLLYVGLGVGGYTDKFGFSGKFLYQNKNNNIYGISYDPIQHFIEFSVYWNIKYK